MAEFNGYLNTAVTGVRGLSLVGWTLLCRHLPPSTDKRIALFWVAKANYVGVNSTQPECTVKGFPHSPDTNSQAGTYQEPTNLEWDLLLSTHQHSHGNAGGLLPCEGYPGQALLPAAGRCPAPSPAIPQDPDSHGRLITLQ